MALYSSTSTLCWATTLSPNTLVTIGSEAIAMSIGNTLCLINLRDMSKLHYRVDAPNMGAGVSVLAGHNRFPLFAYSEAVLRPVIHVIKYPDITKFGTYTAPNITSFTDLRFSEFDHIVAISGYPAYVLCIWNLRSGELMVQHSTLIKCGIRSLACSANGLPTIMQFSNTTKEIYMWEICFRDEAYTLNEISRIPLDKTYEKTFQFNTCFADDGCLYVVNDYGTLFIVEVNDFYLRKLWSMSSSTTKPRPHYLCLHKQGLLLSNRDMVYFVKKKSNNWHVEWTLDLLAHKIHKFVSNFNSEIYCADHVGNLYRVDVALETASLVPCCVNNFQIRAYVLLKGVKDEVLLLLDATCKLQLVNILSYQLVSELYVEGSCAIVAHNTAPLVAVGSSGSKIWMVSYDKLRSPAIVGAISMESSIFKAVRLMDTSGVARDVNNRLYILHIDFRHSKFSSRASIEVGDVVVVDFFMVDETKVLIFVGKEAGKVMLYASELWVFKWQREDQRVTRSEYILPYKYRSFTLGPLANKEGIEIFAVRCDSFVFDAFLLNRNEELVLKTTVVTNHFGHLTGISGSRNLITWGVDSSILHFRSYKKSSKAFMISKFLQLEIVPRVLLQVEECFNSKYLLMLRSGGLLRCFKMPPLVDPVKENTFMEDTHCVIEPSNIRVENIRSSIDKSVKVFVPTEAELRARERVVKSIAEMQTVVRDLIAFDMSVTHKESGVFRKFCLNTVWLQLFQEQARILCDFERQSLLKSITEQERIRDWLRSLITNNALLIGTKIRAIFSETIFENYPIAKPQADPLMQLMDYFLFYDMDPIEEDYALPKPLEEEGQLQVGAPKVIKRYTQASNVYKHVLEPMSAVQDKDELMANQMQNAIIKTKTFLTDALKYEFNKIFNDVHQLKQNMIDSVLGTNATLRKIYDNMNCMRRLLHMETFNPEELSVPVWEIDEVLDRIMTVDDSEVKAVNRRKKKQVETSGKKGRMLLWSVDFWVRSLLIMMDGVLEKLWEEEIKKDVPEPEFMRKKDPHEYTLEDQKAFREYQEKVRLLTEDRRKYLRILDEDERKTLDLKTNFIMKLNTRCTEMAILKLKYDFGIKQEQLRIMTLKLFHFKRFVWRNRINELRKDIEKLNDYIEKYTHLTQFWETSTTDMREKLSVLTARDKTLEKQFKANYINAIPQSMGPEMLKQYKRRPKTGKMFSSFLVCSEIAAKVVNKSEQLEFPLATECLEFLTALQALDESPNMPPQMEPKHWENFIKLRRQKIESELKVKAMGYQVLDFQNATNAFVKEVASLKNIRGDTLSRMDTTASEYFEIVQNRHLQITLNMGQVEINIGSTLTNLKQAILMNLKDIDDVNDLIKAAGAKKLRSMQRVAVFRRKVRFKEWEHRVVRANIEYLKYMLGIISRCKVTMEFLQILRNWKNIKEAKQISSNVGILERAVEQKIASFRRNLDKVIDQIEIVRGQIRSVKKKNREVDITIDALKIEVALAGNKRDVLAEERSVRDRKERMAKIRAHAQLISSVRADYVHILELSTILELQRLRTYPTLPPAPLECFEDQL